MMKHLMLILFLWSKMAIFAQQIFILGPDNKFYPVNKLVNEVEVNLWHEWLNNNALTLEIEQNIGKISLDSSSIIPTWKFKPEVTGKQNFIIEAKNVNGEKKVEKIKIDIIEELPIELQIAKDEMLTKKMLEVKLIDLNFNRNITEIFELLDAKSYTVDEIGIPFEELEYKGNLKFEIQKTENSGYSIKSLRGIHFGGGKLWNKKEYFYQYSKPSGDFIR